MTNVRNAQSSVRLGVLTLGDKMALSEPVKPIRGSKEDRREALYMSLTLNNEGTVYADVVVRDADVLLDFLLDGTVPEE